MRQVEAGPHVELMNKDDLATGSQHDSDVTERRALRASPSESGPVVIHKITPEEHAEACIDGDIDMERDEDEGPTYNNERY